MINEINANITQYQQSINIKETNKNGVKKTQVTIKESLTQGTLNSATYQPEVDDESAKLQTYQVDMDKVIAMKEETDQRLVEMFKATARDTGLKQLGGIRGILDKLRAGESVTLEIEYTAEDVEQAKVDVAEGGYWSADETSDRLIDFAKALSGGDPAKAEMLKDSFKEAFQEIEEMFGGQLPELSYNTFDLTMEKFDNWAAGDE